jgi:FkbM family methyltransferase
MKDYSQHGEQQVITDYFKGFQGTLCDIGANDGITFSNSRALLEQGWYGVLVEPSEKTFEKLVENCQPFTSQVLLHNVGIGTEVGEATFYESGPLVSSDDHSLVSSMKVHETDRWRRKSKEIDPVVEFTKTTIPIIDFATLLEKSGCDTFDFITLDVEGMELEILRQMDLVALSCKMICIEYNGNASLAEEYDRLIPHPVIYKNKTNIVYAEKKSLLITL